MVAKTVLAESRSYSWSSDNTVIGFENDASRFAATLDALTIDAASTQRYGRGGMGEQRGD